MNRRALALIAVFLCLLSLPAIAQVDKGSIEAVALDASKATLPGVTVTVTRPETGFSATTVTDVAGIARFAALAPGHYEVSLELEGFAPVKAQKVTLLVGQTAKLNVTMQQSAVSETITVTGAVPIVDVHKTDSSTNIIPEQIQALPVANREFERLAFLAPGVQRERGGYRFIADGPVIGAGGNASQSTIMVNGVDYTDPALGLARIRFSQDAIREFRVMQNRFDTEIGGSAGGALSIVTKSGTNDIHGNVFGFFRDKSLRSQSALESQKNDYSRQQLGFTLGGPIVRDKTFYFGSVEQINEDSIALFRPGGKYTSLAADVKHPFDRTLLFGSLDQQFSAQMSGGIRGSYEKYDESNFRVGGVVDVSAGQKFERKNWNFTGEHNWSLSNSAFNEARFQYGSRRYSEPTNSDAMSEYFSSGVTLQTGANILGDLLGEGTSYELRDTVHQQFTLGRTSHEVKVGASLQHVKDRSVIDTFQDGLMVYFSDDRSIPFYYAYGVGSSDVTKSTDIWGGFVEDSIALGSKLVVKAGMRYDLDTEGNNPNFHHPLIPNGRERDTNNFQPRLSFNYDIAGDGRNVVRGGAGRFVGRMLLIPAFNELQQNGITGRQLYIRFNGALLGFPVFTLDPTKPTTTGIPAKASIAVMSPTMKSPESDQLSLGWTTRILPRLFLDTEGIYVDGRREIIVRDMNWRGNTVSLVRPDVRWDQINTFTNEGHSKYKALVLSLNGNIRRNDLITASFTLADKKNVNDDFSPALTDYPSDPANIEAEYGRARGTERYHFSVSGIFHAPWAITVAPIYEYGSGQPWSQRLGYDYNGDGRASDRAPGVGRNTMNGPPFRQLSLRVSKGVPVGGYGNLEVIAEAFNVTNVTNWDVNFINNALYLSGPTLAQEMTLPADKRPAKVPNPKYGKAQGTLSPREFQLGLRWLF